MKKKIVVVAVAVIIVFALLAIYETLRTDPNYITKNTTEVLAEDQPFSVEYDYDPAFFFGKHKIPVFSFKPVENGEYTFTVSDVVSEDDGFYLSMDVTDKDLNDYISADNSKDHSAGFEETAFLNRGSKCFIIIQPVSENDNSKCSGSFTLSVTKAVVEAEPQEVKESEPVVITAEKDEQVSVLFRPEEDGFYRFSSDIVSNDYSGSSGISSVRSSDDTEIRSAEGICRLESGKDYYIWISTDDLNKNSADIKVTCKRIETITADQPGSYSIIDDTIIEFTAEDTQTLAVYSDSDGNVNSSVYDSKGFPISSDDDSGEAITGNKKDFALVLQAQKNDKYLIFAGGRFDECKIVIAPYIGDGTSLGIDDIELPEEEPSEEAEETPAEEATEETEES